MIGWLFKFDKMHLARRTCGKGVLALMALVVLPLLSTADSNLAATPIVIASEYGDFYLKLDPISADPEGGAVGAMYRVASPSDELLYKTDGWYARKILLWIDPEFIVRVGNEASPLTSPPERHVALAFYRNGVLTMHYRVSELVNDKNDLDHSTSYYRFFDSAETCRGPAGPLVRVLTTANEELFFEFDTGERVSGKGSVCPWPK